MVANESVALPHAELGSLPPAVRAALRTRYYFDAAAQWCPVGGLNLLSLPEFLNHSDAPNLRRAPPPPPWRARASAAAAARSEGVASSESAPAGSQGYRSCRGDSGDDGDSGDSGDDGDSGGDGECGRADDEQEDDDVEAQWRAWECVRAVRPGEELTIDYREFPSPHYHSTQVLAAA